MKETKTNVKRQVVNWIRLLLLLEEANDYQLQASAPVSSLHIYNHQQVERNVIR